MQKNVQSLIKQIKEYNKSYRLGEDTISDQEYDSLVEELKNLDKDSYEKLREKLFEEKGSFKHKFIIGSLDKIKAGDIKTLDQWKKCIDKTSNLIITPKLDGLSIVLYYTKGKLTHAVTRGDAEYGELQTDKLKLIVPNTLPSKETCIIRGECILSNNNFDKLKNVENKEFKNPRNAAVGLINSKKFNEASIKCLSFIAYQILKSNEPKNLYVHKLEH
jgi:DNA ligase (NAD+)